LNTADSVALEKLYKIGPKLACKIVAYRNKLGGYHKLYQLVEIYGFQEDYLYDLKEQVYINPNKIKKININTCPIEQLQQHPYFKYTLSKQLVNYREQHGLFQDINDLKNIKTVNDSIFQLIKPYVQINDVKN
jgi:DNA uptake protein ComE-like DNA-binding protein